MPEKNKISQSMYNIFQEALDERTSDNKQELQSIAPMDFEHRYEFLNAIGQGAMKNITLHYDKVIDRDVAIAKPLTEKSSDEFLCAFLKESRILAQVAHPNIVPVYELGLDEHELPFCSMKYIKGESLGYILSQLSRGNEAYVKKYDYRYLLNIFKMVCHAISYAHSKGVIHLDIKPDNIIIGEYGSVQVCDWGVAQELTNISEFHQNKVVGTIGYIAPERLRGEDLTPSSDIYSLGATLFHAMALKPPFAGKATKEVLDKLATGSIMTRARFQKPLMAICQKAMHLKLDERYKSVDELIHEIDLFLDDRSPQAHKPKPIEISKLYFKRNRKICTIVISALVVISMLSLVYLHNIELIKIKNKAIAEKAVPYHNDLAQQAYDQFDFSNTKLNTKLAISYGGNADTHWLLAQVYFLEDNLSQALKHAQLAPHREKRFIHIITYLQSLDNEDSEDYFFQKIHALNNDHYPGIIDKVFAVKNKSYGNIESYLPFLEKSIRTLNPNFANYDLQIKDGRISFSAGHGFTRLSPFINLPVDELHLHGSFLRGLEALRGMKKIKTLDISDTLVRGLTPLKGLEIDTLNISKTIIYNLTPIKTFKVKNIIMNDLKLIHLSTLDDYPSLKSLKLSEDLYPTTKDTRLIRKFKASGIIQ